MMQKFRRFGLLAGLGLAWAGVQGGACWAQAAAAGPSTAPRAAEVPLSYFGMHVHDPIKNWPDAPFGRLRLWDTRTAWFNLQPARERFDFARLDAIVEAAARRSVEVVLPLGMTPSWAASRPLEPSPYGNQAVGGASEPQDIDDWRRFVQAVAERYRGRIHHYELWNEVNAGAGFFSGNAEAMLALQRVAYDTLKAVDPANVVISASSVGESDAQLAWFERYLRLMNGRHADVVAYHFYTPRKAPEALLPLVGKVRGIMQRTGNGALPLWNTESGYRVDWGQDTPATGIMGTWPNLAPALAAAYLSRAYLLGWAAGLNGFFWYASDNGLMGLAPRGAVTSTVTQAMRFTARWLVGARLGACQTQDGIAQCALQRGAEPFWMVWTIDDAERSWALPAHINAERAYRLNGEPVPFKGGLLQTVGAEPLVLSRGLLAPPKLP